MNAFLGKKYTLTGEYPLTSDSLAVKISLRRSENYKIMLHDPSFYSDDLLKMSFFNVPVVFLKPNSSLTFFVHIVRNKLLESKEKPCNPNEDYSFWDCWKVKPYIVGHDNLSRLKLLTYFKRR